MFVSVVIPAYNEEEAIGQDLDVIKEALDKARYQYEIIVVDDASTDRTAEVAREKGAQVITHKRNMGAGAGRKTGIRAAKGDVVIMTDADGTYPNQDMPKLLEQFPEYDQVIGARKTEEGTMKWLRWPAKWFIRKVACFLTNTEIPDLNSGLKAFKRDIMLKYLYLVPDGFSCVTSMTLAFLTNGYSVKYIPIDYYKRVGKSKFHPIKDTYRYLLTVIRIIMYFNPLKVFIPLALFVFGLGVVKSIISLNLTSSLQESDIIILVFSILIGAIGMLADLIVIQGKR